VAGPAPRPAAGRPRPGRVVGPIKVWRESGRVPGMVLGAGEGSATARTAAATAEARQFRQRQEPEGRARRVGQGQLVKRRPAPDWSALVPPPTRAAAGWKAAKIRHADREERSPRSDAVTRFPRPNHRTRDMRANRPHVARAYAPRLTSSERALAADSVARDQLARGSGQSSRLGTMDQVKACRTASLARRREGQRGGGGAAGGAAASGSNWDPGKAH